MHIHYLQHVPFENPGSILTWAKKNGHQVTSTHLYEDENLPKTDQLDWLIIMGGPMNIYQEESYPWLKEEKAFIKECIDEDKTILGICLGAQLIADCLGGKVHSNPSKEIGWWPIKWNHDLEKSEIISVFPPMMVVFQWHQDTFDVLGDGTISLARSEACKNQAFQYKNHVFGLQFHMEMTEAIIENLVKNCSEEMTPGFFVQSKREIQNAINHIERNQAWMAKFLDRLYAQWEKEKENHGAYTL